MKDKKIQYEVVGYSKDVSEFSQRISVKDWQINFYVDTVEQAHQVAKLAHLTSYGIKELTPNENGEIWRSSRETHKRIFVTKDVLEWEQVVENQDNADKRAREKAVRDVNALPKKVTLYKDKDFLITAERNDASDGYRGRDVEYRGEIQYKGKPFGSFWRFVTDGYSRKGTVLKKKFAQAVYEKTHNFYSGNKSYDQWKQELKNLPADYVAKYGAVIEKAVETLKEHNRKVNEARRGL